MPLITTATDQKSGAATVANQTASGAASVAAPAAPNVFQVFRNSEAVVALTTPVKADAKQPATAAGDTKQSAAKSNSDPAQYKYHPNLDFATFKEVQELEKLVLHVTHLSGIEINQSLAGQKLVDVAKQFRDLAKTLKDNKASVADKGRAHYQAGIYCEMYFKHNVSEDVRVHARNFFMIKALEFGDVRASIEIAKECLSKDFYVGYSFLTNLMRQGNIDVLQLFQSWYKTGTYVDNSDESVEKYQKFIEEIELRKVKNFISTLDKPGVDRFIAELERKKQELSEHEKKEVERFMDGLKRYRINGCKAKDNLLEEFNLDKIKKYARLDASLTLNEVENAMATKLIEDLQNNLKKPFKLDFLVADYAKNVQLDSTIPDTFIYDLLKSLPDKSITLLVAFDEISESFTRTLKYYSNEIALKFNNRLVAFTDMVANSMGLKTDGGHYEKFASLQLDSCIAEMRDRVRRRTRTASLDLGSIEAELIAGTTVVPLFAPVRLVEPKPGELSRAGSLVVESDSKSAAAAVLASGDAKQFSAAGKMTLGVIKTAAAAAATAAAVRPETPPPPPRASTTSVDNDPEPRSPSASTLKL